MARLGGWKRIGIIASVLWILGAGIFTYNSVNTYEWRTFYEQRNLLREWDEAKAAPKAPPGFVPDAPQESATPSPAPPPETLPPNFFDNKPAGSSVPPDLGEPTEHGPWEAYQDPKPPCKDCALLEKQFLATHRRIALRASALIAFTTVALAWGLAYLILFLVNWVKRGFINPGNSN
jgi:hypothetical protein